MEYQPDEWRDLHSVQRDIVVILAFDAPATGREIDQTRESGTTTESTTYKHLSKLVSKQLITFDDPGPSVARTYSLTDDGRDLVRAAVVETGASLAGQIASEAREDD